VLSGVLLLAAVGTGTTYAAFSGQTQNPGNQLSAKPDWTPPTVDATVIALTNGKSVGTVGRSTPYYVYANVSDAGAPASGVATVVANVAVLTAGQTAVALTSGSYPAVNGTTYVYRSAAITSGAALANGAYTYTHASTDVAGNNRNQTDFPVSVDAVAPTATNIQANNNGGAGGVGVPEAGDTLVYSFSEPIDPTTVLAGWNGGATNVTVSAAAAGVGAGLVSNWSVQGVALGTIAASKHIKQNQTVTFASSMTMSGSTITIVLGSPSNASNVQTNPGSHNLVWTPSATATDMVANATSTAAATETGSDADF
jgi:hypothetical protein